MAFGSDHGHTAINCFIADDTGQFSSTFFCQSDYDRFILDFTTDSGFFIYLFLCRCIPFYLLIALTFKTRRKIFCHLYFWYIGFIYGTVGLLSAFEYGITGLILCIFRLLPQVCFYVPALYATWRMTAGFTDHLLPINQTPSCLRFIALDNRHDSRMGF